MGWGLNLETTLYLNRHTKRDLENSLTDCQDAIKMDRDKLLSLAMSTPREIVEDGMSEGSVHYVDWIFYAQREFDEAFDSLRRNFILEEKLKLFIENKDEITGDD